MKLTTIIGSYLLPIAYHNDLTTFKTKYISEAMDTRNVTYKEPTINEMSEYINKKKYLDCLQDSRISELQKENLAKWILNEKSSQYTINLIAGGLFDEWNDDVL
jgi:hypothetical protein